MVGSATVLRAVLHVVVASSLAAGPPGAGRDYAGSEGVEVAAPAEAAQPGAPAPASAPTGETGSAAAPIVPVPPAAAEGSPTGPAPASAAGPEPVAAEGPEDDAGDELPYDPLVDSPEAIRARSWVRSGAVFTAIGGVLTIGGIAMSTASVNTADMQNICDPRQDVAGNGCNEQARDRAALTLALPGALLLAGGIAMLVVGKLQQRRLRASLRASRRDVFVGLQLAF